jgi:hypothetical protein
MTAAYLTGEPVFPKPADEALLLNPPPPPELTTRDHLDLLAAGNHGMIAPYENVRLERLFTVHALPSAQLTGSSQVASAGR